MSDTINEDISRTRAELVKKIEALGHLLRRDFTAAKETLDDTIGSVNSVVRIFDVPRQVRKRPLLMAGGSMIAGVLVTQWLAGPRQKRTPIIVPPYVPSEPRPSFVASVSAKYPEEVRMLKTAAFGFLVNLAAGRAKASLPHLEEKIDEIERRIKAGLAGMK